MNILEGQGITAAHSKREHWSPNLPCSCLHLGATESLMASFPDRDIWQEQRACSQKFQKFSQWGWLPAEPNDSLASSLLSQGLSSVSLYGKLQGATEHIIAIILKGTRDLGKWKQNHFLVGNGTFLLSPSIVPVKSTRREQERRK